MFFMYGDYVVMVGWPYKRDRSMKWCANFAYSQKRKFKHLTRREWFALTLPFLSCFLLGSVDWCACFGSLAALLVYSWAHDKKTFVYMFSALIFFLIIYFLHMTQKSLSYKLAKAHKRVKHHMSKSPKLPNTFFYAMQCGAQGMH